LQKEKKKKMNKTKMKIVTLGIAVLFAVLTVSTASAHVTQYFDPQDSSVPEGYCNTTEVKVMANITGGDDLRGGQFNIKYNPSCCNIVDLQWGPTIFPMMSSWNATSCWPPEEAPGIDHIRYTFMLMETGVTEICTITLHCKSTEYCETDLTFPDYPGTNCKIEVLNASNDNLYPWNTTLVNGTFTCGKAPTPQAFEKELVLGWNLISLPLNNETDMTVGNIINTSLSGSYDALYKYDTSTHSFVPLSSTDTMENGVGYFIHITSADTWTYSGSAYTSISVSLSEGLNMVGWLNCSKSISGNLTSIKDNYYYIASWNATAALPSFETFNPVAPAVFNDFDEMKRGIGYFISAKAGDILLESCP
jgi:hypothetical protein